MMEISEILDSRGRDVMDVHIKDEWEHGETYRCPFCGSEDFEWVESDDGYVFETRYRWFAWYCSCDRCNNGWYLEYEMVNPRVYKESV